MGNLNQKARIYQRKKPCRKSDTYIAVSGKSMATLGVLLGGSRMADALCFDTQRLPKSIQSQAKKAANSAQAITASEGLYSLFTGGYLPQDVWKHGHDDGWAHVGRLSLSDNMWQWQQQMTDKQNGTHLNTITALAVSPDDSKLACHGWRSKLDNVDHKVGYIFLLRTDTGQAVSGLMRMVHDQSYHVNSSGFLLTDSGIAIMAFDVKGNYNSNATLQRFKIGAINMIINTGHYNLQSSDFYGASSALIRTNSSTFPDLYAAGSYQSSNSNAKWDWAIVRISNAESTSPSFSLSVLQYHDDNKSNWWENGFNNEKIAPMITHLGVNEEAGQDPLLFGLTQSHNHDGGNYHEAMYIWQAKLDPATKDAQISSALSLKVKKLNITKSKSMWAGMRSKMDYESGSAKHYIHAIYQEEEKRDFYIRASPEHQGNIKAIRLNKNDFAVPVEAVWVGQKTQAYTDGGSLLFTAHEAYYAGNHKKYTTLQGDFDTDPSYAVVGIVQDDNLCTIYEESKILDVSIADPNNVNNLSFISSPSFVTDTTTTTFDSSQVLTLQLFDHALTMPETMCNWQETSISTIAPGVNSLSPQCFNYSSLTTLNFDPPSITSPTGCTDAQWLYKIVPDSSLPDNVQFGFDTSLNQVFWSTSDNTNQGYNSGFTYGTFNIQVDAMLQDSSFTTQTDIFNFQLDIDCCAPPTVITAPTVSSPTYTYNIGQALTVNLSGSWTSDNACCTLSADVPVIVSDPGGNAPPAGLFTILNINQQVDVSTSDVTPSGPGGVVYKVTTSATSSSTCISAAADVEYTVAIVNPCLTATFTVDSAGTVFLANTGPSLTYNVGDTTAQLFWKSKSLILGSVSPNNLCGDIIQEMVDVTTNASGDPLPGIIVFDATSNNGDTWVNVITSDTADAKDYMLQLQVYYENFQVATTKVDFMVRVINPCASAVLTIDDSVFKTPSTLTMLQFVNYAVQQLSWTDTGVTSIVTSSITSIACPAYVFDMIDTATNTAPDPGVFTTNFVTPTKTLDVATSVLAKTGTYTLALQVYYDGLRTETEVSKQFTVTIDPYCTPTSITEVQFSATSLTYELGRASASSSFTPWTTVPVVCDLIYTMKIFSDATKMTEITQSLADPTLIVFDSVSQTVTVSGNQVFAGGDHISGTYMPGTYFIEVEANNVNNDPTGTKIDMTVTITDPCDKANSITVLPGIVSPNPIAYAVFDSQIDLTLAAVASTTVTESETIVSCPLIVFVVVGTGKPDSAPITTLYTWDQATQILSIVSSDYSMTNKSYGLLIQAFYSGGGQHSYQEGGSLEIAIAVGDPCANPVSLTDPGQTNPADYAFTGTATFTMNSFNVVPSICASGISYSCLSNTGSRTDLCTIDQNASASKATFDTATGVYTLTSNEYDKLPLETLNPGIARGTYVFSLQATCGSKTALTSFTLFITDGCAVPTISSTGLIDQIYYVSAGPKTYQAAAFTVYQPWCDMKYTFSPSDAALNPAITFDAASRTFTFDYSLDLSLSGPVSTNYVITMTATSNSVTASETFSLAMMNPCVVASVNTLQTPTSTAIQTYFIGSGKQTLKVQDLVTPPFQAMNSLCGGVQFTAELVYNATSTSPSAPIPLNATEGVVKFATDGTFTVQSSDASLLGSHELLISASLIDYPAQVTSTKTPISLDFKSCEVQLAGEWILNDAQVPFNSTLTYLMEEPIFFYENIRCSYEWNSIAINITDAEDNPVEDLSEWISQGTNAFEQSFLARENKQETIMNVKVNATLSDGKTKAKTTFKVIYLAEVIPEVTQKTNSAPYFLIKPQQIYVRFNDPNSTVEVDPVILGKVYDLEGDSIRHSFLCKNCGEEEWFSYNETTGLVEISKGTPEGSYFLSVELIDGNLIDPKKQKYEFNIQVKPPIVVEQEVEVEEEAVNITVTVSNVVEQKEKVKPVFKIVSLDYLGLMKVSFSESMRVVEDLTSFSPLNIGLEVLPDESNEQEDLSKFDFTWVITEFKERSMTMQITFIEPEYISAGLNRDTVRMSILESDNFYAAETQSFITAGTQDKVKAPKMMPNTAFTKAFVGLSGSFGSLTNAGMLGNFFVNLLLSGAMNMLWGLLHSMQIVAHFPLINVMMPGNAQVLFQVIVKVATFDILPTEQVIEEAEIGLGFQHSEVQLTDNFEDFGFDSSDPIRNLQIMFIVIMVLTLFPLFALTLRGLCFCSPKCKRCIKRMEDKFYWNSYIRFGLEAYLELSICAFIRYVGAFSFDNGSESFYSLSSVFLLMTIFAFFMIGVIVPQLHFDKLGTKQFEDRYGDLTLGLNIKDRKALLYPAIFMLRRVLYAGIMVYWISRSYFQIQFMIFKTSLSMLYIGYYRPFLLPSQNNLELTNEFLTLLCTYSLIMFSQMVPDPATRYLCGWQIIFLIVLTLTINLSLIIFQSIRDSIRRCKLKYVRRQKIKAQKKRKQDHERQQSKMIRAQQVMQKDSLYSLNNQWDMFAAAPLQVKGGVELKLVKKNAQRSNLLREHQMRNNDHLSSINEQSEQSQSDSSSEQSSYQQSSSVSSINTEGQRELEATEDRRQERMLQEAIKNSWFDPAVEVERYEAVHGKLNQEYHNSVALTAQNISLNTSGRQDLPTRINPNQGNFGRESSGKKYKIDLMLLPPHHE